MILTTSQEHHDDDDDDSTLVVAKVHRLSNPYGNLISGPQTTVSDNNA
jgi:hypothetical protein